jgi:hypothetical protein
MDAHIKSWLKVVYLVCEGISCEEKALIDTKQLAGAWLDLVLDMWREQVNMACGSGYSC